VHGCRADLGLDGLWWWYDDGEICANVLVSGSDGLGGFGRALLHEAPNNTAVDSMALPK
jgi:hypothetical protein